MSFGLFPGGELSEEEEEDGEVCLRTGHHFLDLDGDDDNDGEDDEDGDDGKDDVQVTPRAVLHSVREEKEPREGGR